MATISKKEIVKAVSEKHGLTTTQTGQIIQVFMDQIIDELSRGNRIEFREFGIFELKRRKPRTARNPKTGASVHVPEKTVVSFKPGKVMKARVVHTLPAGKEEPGTAAEAPTSAPSAAPSPASPPSPAPESAPPPPPPPPPAPAPSPASSSPASSPAPGGNPEPAPPADRTLEDGPHRDGSIPSRPSEPQPSYRPPFGS